MPGLDGIEVLRRIKEMRPETEVIVITGHGDMVTAIKSLQLEASDFVTKPISQEALSVALKRAKERLQLKASLADYTKNLEKMVDETSRKLVEAERLAAIGETVAALGHSVKNMLSGLKGGAYLTKEGLERQDFRRCEQGLEMLERNLGRVAGFVSDLLALSKPREPDTAPADAFEIAAEAVEILGQEAKAKDVELRLKEQPESLVVELERKAILDALLNLVSNAVDAASEVASGRVEVGLEADDERFWFEVSDNGPGLSEEAKEKIFKRFYSSKGASGTGLGLMVAQKTAREHGGRIEFEDRPGAGATFRLSLPRRLNAAQTAALISENENKDSIRRPEDH